MTKTAAQRPGRIALTVTPPAPVDVRQLFALGGPFAAMPGPALLLDRNGAAAANRAGREVADDGNALAALLTLATDARKRASTERGIIQTRLDGREALIDFEAAPWPEGLTLALGRDVTIDIGVREALALSRERYRALLGLAVDFIWETGPEGAIELLAPNEIFGLAAARLIGAPASSLISCRAAGFHAGALPGRWVAAGVKGRDGGVTLGAAIAEPIVDAETGRRRGLRGCFRRTQPLSSPGG